ncbi:MAG: FimB/Mfa2 family fimbrial subunit [Bacteroidetes bacterium]|uniref:FimB/Mfa2 family fimbrial subunit n=1 Tax=Candidatus Cryptobacteroides avicola TaxID=2840757 RepID=A0A940DQH1_9BACT|nr:FimB/Mfa2 family fimbrial subunit [Candidatus Cryptobacteroides avicola]
MKTKFIFAAIAMILAASGCSKENVSVDTIEETRFPLEISVPGPAVKAQSVADEAKVNSLQIYVFRSSGVLEAYGKSLSNKVVTQCTSGTKTIVALANAPDINNALTKAALDARISNLKDNAPGAFVMYGSASKDVSAASGTVSIPVTRMVARVSIQKITNKLELPQYNGTSIQIKRIYLVNAAGDMKYGDTRYGADASQGNAYTPTVWYNAGKCDKDGDLPSLLNSKDLTAAVASSSAPYSVAHYFYCYPNPATAGKAGSARCTRLVVEASINGKLCYYPISISDIKNNHTYNISELVITRIGSENPDTPVSYSQATFTVTVNSWEEGSDTSVTI